MPKTDIVIHMGFYTAIMYHLIVPSQSVKTKVRKAKERKQILSHIKYNSDMP